MLINKFMPGVGPHWLSDGGGEVGVSTTHENTTGLKKKLKKKNLFWVLYMSFILLIFAPSNLGPS